MYASTFPLASTGKSVGRFRIDCEGSAWRVEDELELYAAAAAGYARVARHATLSGRSLSVPSGIAELLAGDDEARIGQTQWSYLSSFSHVTWYGLRQAITSTAPRPGLGPGPITVRDNIALRASAGSLRAHRASQGCRLAIRPRRVGRREPACSVRASLSARAGADAGLPAGQRVRPLAVSCGPETGTAAEAGRPARGAALDWVG